MQTLVIRHKMINKLEDSMFLYTYDKAEAGTAAV